MDEKAAWELLASAKESLEDAEQKLSALAANAEKALTMVRVLPALIANT